MPTSPGLITAQLVNKPITNTSNPNFFMSKDFKFNTNKTNSNTFINAILLIDFIDLIIVNSYGL